MKHLKTFEGFESEEIKEYVDSSAKISTMISCVEEAGEQELADQLRYVAETADDWDSFADGAIEEIQNLKGIDHESATRMFLDFEMQCAVESKEEELIETPAEKTCPECGGNEAIANADGSVSCAECGNTYRLDEKKLA